MGHIIFRYNWVRNFPILFPHFNSSENTISVHRVIRPSFAPWTDAALCNSWQCINIRNFRLLTFTGRPLLCAIFQGVWGNSIILIWRFTTRTGPSPLDYQLREARAHNAPLSIPVVHRILLKVRSWFICEAYFRLRSSMSECGRMGFGALRKPLWWLAVVAGNSRPYLGPYNCARLPVRWHDGYIHFLQPKPDETYRAMGIKTRGWRASDTTSVVTAGFLEME